MLLLAYDTGEKRCSEQEHGETQSFHVTVDHRLSCDSRPRERGITGGVDLPVKPPILPMLAKRVDELPAGNSWIYEPKWDGFRALVFRDGKEIQIQSRDAKPLNRYFPEVVETLEAQLPARCVLDGEIVIAKDGGLDFDSLQLRLHPAASRVKLLSRQIPASVVFFDLLCEGDRDLCGEPFETRRRELERLLSGAAPPVHLTPATRDSTVAADWFRRFEGAGLDGVVAKPIHGTYEPNKRVMLKVKHERDCDCVVAGFRWYKESERAAVGSLLLGLYDDSGALQHVGVCASFTAEKRRELVEFLAPYREKALAKHPWKEWADVEPGQRMPGGQSRWSQGKDLSWEPLRPELVVEVAYEHMQGPRFRHMAHFRRWRPDKPPRDCTYAQLEVVAPHELSQIFAGR
jgi:ATP-dependent DNA ligase